MVPTIQRTNYKLSDEIEITDNMNLMVEQKKTAGRQVNNDDLCFIDQLRTREMIKNEEMQTIKIVTDYLLAFGIPANIKGYKYVRQAIILCLKDPEQLESVTKNLYPNVGKQFNSTGSRVERAIRHSIESCWSKGWADPNFVYDEFGNVLNEERKPTNSEFIAVVVDRIRLNGLYFENTDII